MVASFVVFRPVIRPLHSINVLNEKGEAFSSLPASHNLLASPGNHQHQHQQYSFTSLVSCRANRNALGRIPIVLLQTSRFVSAPPPTPPGCQLPLPLSPQPHLQSTPHTNDHLQPTTVRNSTTQGNARIGLLTSLAVPRTERATGDNRRDKQNRLRKDGSERTQPFVPWTAPTQQCAGL